MYRWCVPLSRVVKLKIRQLLVFVSSLDFGLVPQDVCSLFQFLMILLGGVSFGVRGRIAKPYFVFSDVKEMQQYFITFYIVFINILTFTKFNLSLFTIFQSKFSISKKHKALLYFIIQFYRN